MPIYIDILAYIIAGQQLILNFGKVHLLCLLHLTKGLDICISKNTVPSHEIILLPSIFVPDCNVHISSLLIIQVEIKLLSPLGVQCFWDCLNRKNPCASFLYIRA